MTTHAQEAARALDEVRSDPWLLKAQVHATLALAEQQRIANLLTAALHEGRFNEEKYALREGAIDALIAWASVEDADTPPALRPEIAAALGIEQES